MSITGNFNKLANTIDGDVFTGEAIRLMYATDASVYREVPVAVVRPRNKEDIIRLVNFAREQHTSLIPRGAGTSLAGQVVGNGIVVDISRYMTAILEINEKEQWVRVEPGVVLDELNQALFPFGLFFGPETSTSNRCMIGGMVGNNACGAHSLIYGSTRDHLLSVKMILSDGSEAEFNQISKEEFRKKCEESSLESNIYRNIRTILSNEQNQQEIRKEFPDKKIKRRNTGYAIDLLLDTNPFTEGAEKFNFCKLIAGSEGTLGFMTEIKLHLVPLPPAEKALVCVHFDTLEQALKGNLLALKHKPGAVELMDKTILNLTRDNIGLRKNRFFLEDEPGAILIVEFARDTREEIDEITSKLEKDLQNAGLGYHFPVISGDDIQKVWALRRAGLGVLSNMPGDSKPVSVIEDTAVLPEDLPDYIMDFNIIIEKHGLECVYHAHIATGELHLRPVLNLKDPEHVELFRTLAREIAVLVKKYRGSLSGEHGDGRLRGEFIPVVIGQKNFQLLKEIKQAWDPGNIFNPGKITGTPRMNTGLRHQRGRKVREIETYFDFSEEQGVIRAVEKCNGSGDCRKSEVIGGTMCPSYMATRDENAATRARANLLREFLINSTKKNPFDHKELYEVMDLCLSCKACLSECPSNIDMTRYKAEFLQHYYDANGVPIRSWFIAHIPELNRLGSLLPGVYNFAVKNKLISGILKKILGFTSQRSLPALYKTTLRAWAKAHLYDQNDPALPGRKIYLFVDEFTDYQDVQIGIKTIQLLQKLGYEVDIPKHTWSGRTFLSKGLVRKAKKIANENVLFLKEIVTSEKPLIGIEPSGILSFRDEYPKLVSHELKEAALDLADNCFLIEEFLAKEAAAGRISRKLFTGQKKHIKVHGHCHQKSLASVEPTLDMLSIPEHYTTEEIKSGCCGMAGAFGYEKEHYELSMKVGELVLFPEVRKTAENILIAAPGTSCRQQIKDGTGRLAYHPVEILYEALIDKDK